MTTSLANYRNDLLKKAATRIVGSSVYITTGVAVNFTVPKGATSTLPGEIVLTAVTTRYVNPQYKWYVKTVESGTFTEISGATAATYTVVGNAAFLTALGSSAAMQYKVAVTEGTGPSANPSDFTVTLPVLREGVNSIIGYLTNDTLNVPANSSGVVDSGTYAALKSTYIIYNGATDDSANWTVAITSSSGITAVLEAGKTIAITNITSSFAAGYVEITASRQGYADVVKRVAVTKLNAGTSPVIYSVEPASPVVVKNANGTYTPSSLTVSGYSQVGSTKSAYAGRFKIYENNSATASYTSSANESSKAYSVTGSVTTLKVELYQAGGTTVLLDTQSIPVTEAGSSAVTITVTNNTYAIPALSTGAVASYEESGTNILVREGNNPLVYRTTLGTNKSSFTIGTPTISNASGIVVGAVSVTSNGTTTATVLKHSAMTDSLKTITITYPVTYVRANGGEATEYVTQTITKSTDGIRGSRTLYASGAAYVSTYDYDGAGTVAAGAASYAKKASDLVNAATAGSSPRAPIEGDTVTFSNGSTTNGYVYTITYKASTAAWTPPGTVLDGSLIVTGSVTASKINSNGLSIKDSNGKVILSAGSGTAWSKNPNIVRSLKTWSIASTAALVTNSTNSQDGNLLKINADARYLISRSPRMDLQTNGSKYTVSFRAYYDGIPDTAYSVGFRINELASTTTTWVFIYSGWKNYSFVMDYADTAMSNCSLDIWTGDNPYFLYIGDLKVEADGSATPWISNTMDNLSIDNKLTSSNASTYIDSLAVSSIYLASNELLIKNYTAALAENVFLLATSESLILGEIVFDAKQLIKSLTITPRFYSGSTGTGVRRLVADLYMYDYSSTTGVWTRKSTAFQTLEFYLYQKYTTDNLIYSPTFTHEISASWPTSNNTMVGYRVMARISIVHPTSDGITTVGDRSITGYASI